MLLQGMASWSWTPSKHRACLNKKLLLNKKLFFRIFSKCTILFPFQYGKWNFAVCWSVQNYSVFMFRVYTQDHWQNTCARWVLTMVLLHSEQHYWFDIQVEFCQNLSLNIHIRWLINFKTCHFYVCFILSFLYMTQFFNFYKQCNSVLCFILFLLSTGL